MAIAGLFLRSSSTLIRALQFLCAAGILGIFSYFLADLHKHHLHIQTYVKAVEGIAGGAVIYTAFAVILTCFLGGIVFFAFLAIFMDVLFLGAFIAVAVLTRASAKSCSGTVSTPLGKGLASAPAAGAVKHMSTACKLQKTVFALAVAAAVLFLLSAILQHLLGKHHQKEKRFGPGPSNNYGAKRSFGRKKKPKTAPMEDNAELGALPAVGAVGGGGLAAEKHLHNNTNGNGVQPSAYRPSHETGMTGSTMANQETTAPAYGGPNTKYAAAAMPVAAAETQARTTRGTAAAAPTTGGAGYGGANQASELATGGGRHYGHDHGGLPTRDGGVGYTSEPYAVHHGGMPHVEMPGKKYSSAVNY